MDDIILAIYTVAGMNLGEGWYGNHRNDEGNSRSI